MISQWMILLLSHHNNTWPSYSGHLLAFFLEKHPATQKPSFFSPFLKSSQDSSPVTRYFRNGACTFRCNKPVKMRLCFYWRVRGEPIKPISTPLRNFETTNDRGLVDIEVVGYNSCCQAFVLFHGR